MKRIVYVPFSALENEEIPKIALDLAKETKLTIRIGVEDQPLETEVCVLSIPEYRKLEYKKTVVSNYIQSIDYTNEFIVFPYDTLCSVKYITSMGERGTILSKLKLRENHVVKYRDRFNKRGDYSFTISTPHHGTLCEGQFTVT
jgi:hypothetical protein